jgi:hypothetical protein
MLAGVLLEVGHHDAHNIVLDSTPVLSSHECGATEIHIPLDKRHDCLACTQSTLRVGMEEAQHIGVHTAFVCLAFTPFLREQPLETDVFHSGKRGPPLA